MRPLSFGRYDYAAFLSFFAYAAGSVVVPVALVSIAHDLDFTLEEGGMGDAGLLHLGRTVAMVAAMIVCGFLAGRYGKRRTLGWSVVVMCLGVLLCAVAPAYGILFLALFIAGLGEGVIEGIATPFVAAMHPEEPGRYINFSHAFWSVGVFVAVLATGGLISLGVPWRFLVAAAALVALGAALLILLPQHRDRPYPEHLEPLRTRAVVDQAHHFVVMPRFWVYFAAMFFGGGGEFCLTFWCAAYIQLYFVHAAWAGGVGTACFAAGMFLGRTGSGVFIAQHRLKGLILGTAIVGSVLTLAIPWITNLYILFALLFATGIAVAPYWPSVQSLAADRLPLPRSLSTAAIDSQGRDDSGGHSGSPSGGAGDTTMLFILLSCAGVPGCGVLTWLMGVIGDATGNLRVAFYLVPACFVILSLLIALDRRTTTQPDARP